MHPISHRHLKEAILRTLDVTPAGSTGAAGDARRSAHKMNLIGRPYQSGELEAGSVRRSTRTTARWRHAPSKSFSVMAISFRHILILPIPKTG